MIHGALADGVFILALMLLAMAAISLCARSLRRGGGTDERQKESFRHHVEREEQRRRADMSWPI